MSLPTLRLQDFLILQGDLATRLASALTGLLVPSALAPPVHHPRLKTRPQSVDPADSRSLSASALTRHSAGEFDCHDPSETNPATWRQHYHHCSPSLFTHTRTISQRRPAACHPRNSRPSSPPDPLNNSQSFRSTRSHRTDRGKDGCLANQRTTVMVVLSK